MMDRQVIDHVKKLFEDKLSHFIDIKSITIDTAAAIASESDLDEQADAYISMMNKRERLFKKIDVIDEALKSSEYFETSCCDEFNDIKDEIKAIVRTVLSMEDKNKVEGVRIKNEIALKIKGLRSGKDASVAYNRDALYSGVSRFDSNN